MKVFYHNDADGKCAGHIIAKKFPELGYDDFIKINYGDDFSFDIIEKEELVYIVDYSIEPREMEKLLSITSNVIWIDHHKTAIQTYQDFKSEIKGLRYDGLAGCVLTWIYLHDQTVDNYNVPLPVKFIGDRDVWAWEYGKETLYFCSGSESYDLHPLSKAWKKLFEAPSLVMEEGKTIEKYKKQRNKEYLDSFSYETVFEGYKSIVINLGHVGSEVFGDKLESEYDVGIMYAYDGKEYHVSLRSERIDVSKIAKKFSGGGHAGASGFECLKLPFNKTGDLK